jgi:hypothetical protein
MLASKHDPAPTGRHGIRARSETSQRKRVRTEPAHACICVGNAAARRPALGVEMTRAQRFGLPSPAFCCCRATARRKRSGGHVHRTSGSRTWRIPGVCCDSPTSVKLALLCLCLASLEISLPRSVRIEPGEHKKPAGGVRASRQPGWPRSRPPPQSLRQPQIAPTPRTRTLFVSSARSRRSAPAAAQSKPPAERKRHRLCWASADRGTQRSR